MLEQIFALLDMKTTVIRHGTTGPGSFEGHDVVVVSPGPGDPWYAHGRQIIIFRAPSAAALTGTPKGPSVMPVSIARIRGARPLPCCGPRVIDRAAITAWCSVGSAVVMSVAHMTTGPAVGELGDTAGDAWPSERCIADAPDK